MFNKEKFGQVLSLAKGDRTIMQFANDSGVSRTYISDLLKGKRVTPPSPEILEKISAVASNGINYSILMEVAGHITLTEDLTNLTLSDKKAQLANLILDSLFLDQTLNEDNLSIDDETIDIVIRRAKKIIELYQSFNSKE